MSCSWSEDRFEAYLDGTLAPRERGRLLTHLRGCGPCTGILEELRVVDALLAVPRHVDLPENFTFATMAEVRTLPRPSVSSVPALAYVASYLFVAWIAIGAGFIFAPNSMRALFETAVDASASMLRTLALLGHAGTRVLDDLGTAPSLFGAAIIVDVAVVTALVLGFRFLRPRLLDRLRS